MEFNIEFSKENYPNTPKQIEELARIALNTRQDIIKSLFLAKSGHSGGPLGISDVMSVLFFAGIMKYDSQNPNWKERDRFVLSCGHYAPVLYTVLARAGYFPTEELLTLRKLGSRLQGHPGLDSELPGIETSSGSLGQGISIAVGMAMSDKLLEKNDRTVFCLTGDGEIQEGSCWEAAMSAGNFKLDNLCWIVDNNNCQIDGRVEDVMSIYPLGDKFQTFKFEVIEIDGHNFNDIIAAFNQFKQNQKNRSGKPTVIICKTKMGRGVSFMEDNYQWHGNPPNEKEAIQALSELI
ncbi:MAG: transketolase [Candidatus Kapabacteria bacterium]|nr:transketolase [Candidatus Kapabacteria bacterium]